MSHFAPFGDGAWRLAVPPGTDVRALIAFLRGLRGVEDVIVTETFACVFADRAPELPVFDSFDDLAPPSGIAHDHLIRVRYDGPDLDDVAARIGISREALINLHLGAKYTVAFLGFMPGFGYLRGLPEALALRRRSSPRARVPPGSVAIAGGYAGVYPHASAGGWHLIGTAIEFSAWTKNGAALTPGDHVRFERVE